MYLEAIQNKNKIEEMYIEIDYNPTPKNTFFISVEVGKNEAISFDYTSKGHRITKQILVELKSQKGRKIDGEWDAIIIKNRKFIKKYHVKWIDMGQRDWVNDEIWKIVWAKPMLQKIKNKLLYYSQLISNNYKNLNKYSKELIQFEYFLSEQIAKYK